MASKECTSKLVEGLNEFLGQLDDFETVTMNIRLKIKTTKQSKSLGIKENGISGLVKSSKASKAKRSNSQSSVFSSQSESMIPRLCILEEHTERDEVSQVEAPEPSPFSQSDFLSPTSTYSSQFDNLIEPRLCVISEDSKTDDVSNFSEMSSLTSHDQVSSSTKKKKSVKKKDVEQRSTMHVADMSLCSSKPVGSSCYGIGILEENTEMTNSTASKFSSSSAQSDNSSQASKSQKPETISKARKHKDGKAHPFQAIYYDARIPDQTPRGLWAYNSSTTSYTADPLTYDTSVETFNLASRKLSETWEKSHREKHRVKSTRKGSSSTEKAALKYGHTGTTSQSSSSEYTYVSAPSSSESERQKPSSKRAANRKI